MRQLITGILLGLTGLSAVVPMASAEVGVTDHEIRIGIYGPFTGPYAIGSLQHMGAAAIYKSVNDAGGINGRKIKLSIEDAACDGNKAIAAVKKLIAQDKVFMIHGGWCSDVEMAIRPQIIAHPDLPFVNLGAASAAILEPFYPNIFQPVITTKTVAKGMVDFALSIPGVKRIAIISHSDEWAKSQMEPSVALLKSKGIEPVETQWLEHGAVSAASQVLKIRQAKPDVVLAYLYPPELTTYLTTAYKYNVRVPTVTTQAADINDMVKRVDRPDATKNLFVFYPLLKPTSDPSFDQWREIFQQYYPKQPVQAFSFMGMTGALAIVQALKAAGQNLTRQGFMEQLDKLRDFEPGLQPPLTFTPSDHEGIKEGKMIYWSTWPKGDPEVITSYPTAK